jgi:viologen exporter family transport system permease protein
VSALRAIPTLLRVGFAAAVAYRAEFVVWILTYNMPLVMLALWTEVAREAPIAGFGDKDLIAYFLLTLIVRLLTGNWVVWEMNTEIRQGDLAMRLLRPIHPFIVYATDNVSQLPIRLTLSLPVVGAILYWAGGSHLAPDFAHWAIGLTAIAGAWALVFAVMLLIGSLGLMWESSLALVDLWLGLFFVFSGYLMPLAFFPGWLRALSWWLPFRYTLAFPVETMLGSDSIGQALRSLGVQWAYIAGIGSLALLVWRRGLVRYAVYGG